MTIQGAAVRTTSSRVPNRRRPQQVFDDIGRKLAPFDTDALLQFPRDMCLDHGSPRRWRRKFDADLDEGVKTKIAIGLHERTAQTEVLHATVSSGQRGC